MRACARLNVLRESTKTATHTRLKIARALHDIVIQVCARHVKERRPEREDYRQLSIFEEKSKSVQGNNIHLRRYISGDVRKRRSDIWKYRTALRSRCAVYDFARRCTALGLSREIVVLCNL